MSFHKKTNHKSQKDRRCEFCRTMILKGDLYIKNVGSYDGDFYTYSTHLSCETTLELYLEEHNYELDINEAYDWAVEQGYIDVHRNDFGGE